MLIMQKVRECEQHVAGDVRCSPYREELYKTGKGGWFKSISTTARRLKTYPHKPSESRMQARR